MKLVSVVSVSHAGGRAVEVITWEAERAENLPVHGVTGQSDRSLSTSKRG